MYLRCTQISVSSDGISGHLCSRPTICPVSMIVNYEIPPIFLPIAQKVSYKPQVWVPHLFTHIPVRAGSLRSPRPRPITASGGCSYSSRAVTLKILQKKTPPCQCLTAWIQGARPKVAERMAGLMAQIICSCALSAPKASKCPVIPSLHVSFFVRRSPSKVTELQGLSSLYDLRMYSSLVRQPRRNVRLVSEVYTLFLDF